MQMLHILKSEPDDTMAKMIDIISRDKFASVFVLYGSHVDWKALVDDIFSHDRVICWW